MLVGPGTQNKRHRARARRAITLVEVLIGIGVLGLGSLIAARALRDAVASTAERTARRILTLSDAPVHSDSSPAQASLDLQPSAAPQGQETEEPSLLDRGKQLLGWTADHAKDAWNQKLAEDRKGAGAILQGSKWVKDRLNDAEDLQVRADEAILERTQGVPGLNVVLEPTLRQNEQRVEAAVGSTKSVVNLATGLGVVATDPVDTAVGLTHLAAHVPSPMGINGVKVGLSAYDTLTGQAKDGELKDALTPHSGDQEDLQYLWNSVSSPYKEGWDRGKYTEVTAQAGTDIAIIVLGPKLMPGASAAGEAAGVAGETVEVTGATGELAVQTARGAEVTAGGTEVTGGAVRAGEAAEAETAAGAARAPEAAAADGAGAGKPPSSGKSAAPGSDEPFEAPKPNEPSFTHQHVADLIADSNPNFRLTEANAKTALTGPEGTTPEVAGSGGAGADIQFVDEAGNTVLKREVKSVEGGYNSFNSSLKKGLQQAGSDGEVFMQVKSGTDVESWLSRYRGSRTPEELATKAGNRVHVFDEHGQLLYSGPIVP